MIKHQKTQA